MKRDLLTAITRGLERGTLVADDVLSQLAGDAQDADFDTLTRLVALSERRAARLHPNTRLTDEHRRRTWTYGPFHFEFFESACVCTGMPEFAYRFWHAGHVLRAEDHLGVPAGQSLDDDSTLRRALSLLAHGKGEQAESPSLATPPPSSPGSDEHARRLAWTLLEIADEQP